MPDVKLHTLIVDDEPLARRRLRRLLSSRPELHIVGDCDSGAAAIARAGAGGVDLLVADVEMPGLSGLELIRALPEPKPAVIFVTAHDEYAARAFDESAVDYVLKPVRAARLYEAVRRVVARVAAGAPAEKPQYVSRLPVTRGAKIVPVPVEKVDWIEAAENYVTLHCGDEALLYRSTLSEVAALLDPAHFLRIHRSVIVRLDRVRAVVPSRTGDYAVELATGARLRLSRSYRASLDRLLTGR